MDHMRECLNKKISVACLSTLLLHVGMLPQVGLVQTKVSAESLTVDQEAKSSASTSSTSSDVALVSDISDKAKSEAKPATASEAVIGGPKVSIKNPPLDLKITPRESKMDASSFESPTNLGKPMNFRLDFRATAYSLINALTAPKISIKNPSLDLKTAPRESKMDARSFESP